MAESNGIVSRNEVLVQFAKEIGDLCQRADNASGETNDLGDIEKSLREAYDKMWKYAGDQAYSTLGDDEYDWIDGLRAKRNDASLADPNFTLPDHARALARAGRFLQEQIEQFISVLDEIGVADDVAFNRTTNAASVLVEALSNLDAWVDATPKAKHQGVYADAATLYTPTKMTAALAVFVRAWQACGDAPVNSTTRQRAEENIVRDKLGRPMRVGQLAFNDGCDRSGVIVGIAADSAVLRSVDEDGEVCDFASGAEQFVVESDGAGEDMNEAGKAVNHE